MQKTSGLSSIKYPVLLYDGLCGFCNGSVRFILKNESSPGLYFMALQSLSARSLIDNLNIDSHLDSLILVEEKNGQELIWYAKSTAAFRLLKYLKPAWRVLGIFKIIPVKIADRIYGLIARYRKKIFVEYTECPLPEQHLRDRFIFD